MVISLVGGRILLGIFLEIPGQKFLGSSRKFSVSGQKFWNLTGISGVIFMCNGQNLRGIFLTFLLQGSNHDFKSSLLHCSKLQNLENLLP
jgi:hypothetical protein